MHSFKALYKHFTQTSRRFATERDLKLFKKYANHSIFRSAIRLNNILAYKMREGFQPYVNDFRLLGITPDKYNKLSSYTFSLDQRERKVYVLAHPVETPEGIKIKVFPNMFVWPLSGNTAGTGWWEQSRIQHIFNVWVTVFNSDRRNEGRKNKWSDLARARATMKTSETISIGRWMQKYTSLGNTYSVELVTSWFTPPEIKFCETEEDYTYMYENNSFGSCMNSSSSCAEGWGEAYNNEETNFHPALFYYHCPEIQGVYMVQRNRVVARTLFFPKHMQYLRTFHASGATQDIFQKILKRDYGLTRSSSLITLEEHFNIPAYDLDERVTCPTPYLDSIQYGELKLLYTKKDKCFKFQEAEGHRIDAHKTSGYTYKEHLETLQCAGCSNITTDFVRDDYFIAKDNTIFCSSSCMRQGDYCSALQSNGIRVIIPQADAVCDPLDETIWFTTYDALRQQRGAANVVDMYGEWEEGDTSTTVLGYSITTPNGGQARIHNSQYEELSRLGMFIHDSYELSSYLNKKIKLASSQVHIVKELRIPKYPLKEPALEEGSPLEEKNNNLNSNDINATCTSVRGVGGLLEAIPHPSLEYQEQVYQRQLAEHASTEE